MPKIDKISNDELKQYIKLLGENIDYIKALLKYFADAKKKFDELSNKDHDLIGRILKCHLIIEQYMGSYLIEHYKIIKLEEANMTYYQKAKLLPEDTIARLVKQGILELNKIRNKFGHDIDALLIEQDINEIKDIVFKIIPVKKYNTLIEVIEEFTFIVCSLFILPPELKEYLNSKIEHGSNNNKNTNND